MFDDVVAFYNENVVDSFVEYRDLKNSIEFGRNRDVRSAIRTCSALFHFREHLPHANQMSRSAAERICSDYGLVGDIANATKHKTLNSSTPHGQPYISRATQISERMIVTAYEDSAGEYRHTEKAVIVELNDGTERHVIEVMTNVINFWEQFLQSENLLNNPRTFTTNRPEHPLSRDACAKTQPNLEIIRGRRLALKWQFQKYRSDTGEIEIVDLTGAEVKFRIFEPPKTLVDVEVKHDATGQCLKKTVTLTNDQRNQLESMTDENGIKKFVEQLPEIRDAMAELNIEAQTAIEDAE